MNTKTRLIYTVSRRNPLQIQGPTQTESEGMKKGIPWKWKSKSEVAGLISDKRDFKIKAVIRDKEGHYVVIKWLIQEEDITIITIYVPNIGTPQYIKQMITDIKGEINSNTIIVGTLTSPLTSLDRSYRQKIIKDGSPWWSSG